MCFNENEFEAKLTQYIPEEYISKSKVSKQLDNGYLVNFANFILPQKTFLEPIELDISGENHTL